MEPKEPRKVEIIEPLDAAAQFDTLWRECGTETRWIEEKNFFVVDTILCAEDCDVS
jgi:hypothetical protein